ncbi:OprD family outer membrane porin [bacterium]|nr:OprD family outer membrane porin [bacterium]MBU1990865.1 OprD family outer membrane porin [bacterium]
MKKFMALSAITAGLLSSVNVYAAEDLSTMFSEGKTSGQIRMFSIDRTYNGTAGNTTHRNGTALGGNLKFETAAYEGLSLGTAFYTTNKIASSPTVDPTLYGIDNNGYSILGEAYLQYKRGNTTFKGGRQKLDTPLAGSDDARMVPNLFEAYLLINTDLPDTTLIAGHVTRFAQGTFGRAYGAGGLVSVTSGYSAWDASNQVGDFVNMGTYAINQETSGVSVVSATYTGIENLKIQVWDYYAHNILNALYGQVDYSWKCLLSDKVKPFAGAQLIKENEVGDKLAGRTDGLYVGAKFGAKIENFTAYIAYSQTTANEATDAATENAIITPWGGMPAFTQGMVTRHQFLAGTKASKIAASYNFKDLGADLSTTVYYASFDMDANSGYGVTRVATEPGFDIIYNPEMVKKLQLRFRGNFPSKFAESAAGDTGWNEYRFIANYNF